MNELKSKIESIPDNFSPIKKQAEKYFHNNSKLDDFGNIMVLHRPWVAPFNWGIVLFKALEDSSINEFLKRTNKNIPLFYQDFLLSINGCFLYDLDLFGMNLSILESGLLDRSVPSPFDLTTANTSWINEYNVENSFFHFGSKSHSRGENVGYFVDGNNEIFSMLKDGTVIDSWNNFRSFLTDEISLSEDKMIANVPKGTALNSSGY